MVTVQSIILDKERDLIRLKEQLKESYDSVKKHWESTYHNSFTDHCEMVYLLMQGKKYSPYNFSKGFKIERGKKWKSNELYEYANIYEGFGSPIGFISLKEGLFNATKSKHKDMWIKSIRDNREVRSFDDYVVQLKTDFDFLRKSFETSVKESGSGAYHNSDYLVEFEEKRLKTDKYYIWLEGTTRKY